MSYDVRFKAKIEGTDQYVDLRYCMANITWNVKDIIKKSTGLPWRNGDNNGLVKNVVPKIMAGMIELYNHGENYKKYEPDNGLGTVELVYKFFAEIVQDFDLLRREWPKVADVATFWIE